MEETVSIGVAALVAKSLETRTINISVGFFTSLTADFCMSFGCGACWLREISLTTAAARKPKASPCLPGMRCWFLLSHGDGKHAELPFGTLQNAVQECPLVLVAADSGFESLARLGLVDDRFKDF